MFIKLTAQAKRELKKLSQEEKISISEVIEDLKENPLIGKQLDRGLTGKFSYRSGVYRIIYKVNLQDQTITILSAKHRGVAYN